MISELKISNNELLKYHTVNQYLNCTLTLPKICTKIKYYRHHFSDIILYERYSSIRFIYQFNLSYLWLFDGYRVAIDEFHWSQFLALPVHRVHFRLRTESHLNQTSVVRVQPFPHGHLLHHYTVRFVSRFQFFLFHSQMPLALVLEFDNAITGSGTDERNDSQEYTHINVHQFVSLQINNNLYFKKSPTSYCAINRFGLS